MLDLTPAPSFAAYVLDRPAGRATRHGLSGRPTTSIETIAPHCRELHEAAAPHLPTSIMIRRRAEKRHVDELLGALDTLSTELGRPGLAVRIHVSTHRLSLDRELARGDSPLGSAALALRARQLVSPRTRERLAAALERLVECAKRRPAPSEIVWVPHREILETRSELLGLASRLRDATGVRARGSDGLATDTRWHRTCLHSACWWCPGPRDRGGRKCTRGPVARRTRDSLSVASGSRPRAWAWACSVVLPGTRLHPRLRGATRSRRLPRSAGR